MVTGTSFLNGVLQDPAYRPTRKVRPPVETPGASPFPQVLFSLRSDVHSAYVDNEIEARVFRRAQRGSSHQPHPTW